MLIVKRMCGVSAELIFELTLTPVEAGSNLLRIEKVRGNVYTLSHSHSVLATGQCVAGKRDFG